MHNKLFPIFVKLENKPCLVIGAGLIAEQKLAQLLDAEADITIIAPDVSENIKQMVIDGVVGLEQRPYKQGDGQGYFMIVGATNNTDVNKKVYQEAQELNTPVNIVDVPELCSFYLGSVHKEGDLTVVVSTNGKSPTLGKIIRNEVRDRFGADYGKLLNKLGDLRQSVFAKTPHYNERKAIFEEIVHKELKLLEEE